MLKLKYFQLDYFTQFKDKNHYKYYEMVRVFGRNRI